MWSTSASSLDGDTRIAFVGLRMLLRPRRRWCTAASGCWRSSPPVDLHQGSAICSSSTTKSGHGDVWGQGGLREAAKRRRPEDRPQGRRRIEGDHGVVRRRRQHPSRRRVLTNLSTRPGGCDARADRRCSPGQPLPGGSTRPTNRGVAHPGRTSATTTRLSSRDLPVDDRFSSGRDRR